jgi:hypothetical protein
MLKISESQMDAFRRQSGADFITRVIRFLRENFPEYREAPDDAMKQAIETFMERAQSYELESEIHIVSFVLAAHYFGGDFDLSNASFRTTLSDSGKTPEWKANWLEAMCLLIEGKRERGEL